MNNSSITYLFSAFTTKFRDMLEKQISPLGLHGGQVFVLISLWENDGQSQAELVKNLNVRPPTVYNLVVKLADLNFVEIKKDSNDARIMRVYLTRKGIEIKPSVESEWQKLEQQIFGILTEPERMMCALLMQRLVSHILPSK